MSDSYLKVMTKKQLHEVNEKFYQVITEMIITTVSDTFCNYIMTHPFSGPKPSKKYISDMLRYVDTDMWTYKEQIESCVLKSFGAKVDYKMIANDLWNISASAYISRVKKAFLKKGKNGKARICPRSKR